MTLSSASHSARPAVTARAFALDLAATFVISMVVFGPITGLRLSGFDFIPDWHRPLILSAIVTAGRGLFRALWLSPLGRAWLQRKKDKSMRVRTVPASRRQHLVLILLTVIVLAVAPFLMENSSYLVKAIILALIYVLLGLGLNIVVGLAGLLDLGYVGFYALGAYLLALGHQFLGLDFWAALVLSPIAAAILGGLLAFPVLRTHGDYLAIVTLGFGEIIRLVLTNWVDVTGGPNGIQAPAPTLFGMEFFRVARDGGVPFHEAMGLPYNPNTRYLFIYMVLVAVVALMVFVVDRLRRMPMGQAWEALREDEVACRSLGINHVTVKLSAFIIGAMTGGIAGVFFASYQGFVNPSSFTFFESALILAIIVLGGLGSITGVIIAAFALTLAPELLRDFADYRILLFGLLMVLMMIWRPRGLIATRRPVIELPRG
ncbi:high-affinity branched-chain amino acid ABC transporter permease LivM [Brenneria tiliae]|uniref:High-affinity branched-chain amino acid ABC transporter permease LivM n=1 Tax=Brenneria tiliae TaxID=2914984 RepID=A0ABT0MV71_9GAMM|nr:high-affinity branched-chain amino acid ABC transporter permease LivM [Brenneria tiliae]MCL2893755.1 high-affinity branched-chain amino acid ABC transporter permease LivM [Brenneria tiliae]